MCDSATSLSVLLVDDDTDFAESVAAFLERMGDRFSVLTATSAAEGRDVLDTTSIDCVVSEYDLPGESGLDFLQTVREETPKLPFILCTEAGSEAVASESISAGVTDYLRKERGTGQHTVLANRIENAVEQYHSQAALEASEKRLSFFIEQSPLGVIEYNSDFEIVRVNDTAEEILGYSEAELRGETWERLVAEESHDDVEAIVTELSNAAGGYHSIDENLRKDGDRIVCEWYNRLVTDENGDVVAVFSQFQDVTERTRRESQLRETTARLTALFEESPDMINVHNLDGDILDPNPRLCEETGYTAAELTDMKVWELDHGMDAEKADTLWTGMERGDRRRVEGSYRRKDGSTFPVEVHVRRLNLAGEDRFVAISRDVSEQREREQQLQRQNERLNEFASVVSHDLRNPLNIAEGNIDLAREEHDSDNLATARRALDRIRALIDDLLTLAREGDDVGDVEPVALSSLVEVCWGHVETGDASLRTDLSRTVVADRSRLQQLVENLIRNSIEHGGDGVTVTVGDLSDGFYVEDDGTGIPAEHRDSIFEAGYSTSRSGTGFGLRIVKQVAEAHGWQVHLAESETGGARFEITGVEFAETEN